MNILTVKEMQKFEKNIFEKTIIPETLIIENVAIRSANIIIDFLEENSELDHVCVLVGRGNNGADGVAIARQLYNLGLSVEVVYLFDQSKFSESLLFEYHLAELNNVLFSFYHEDDFELLDLFDEQILYIDAVFGTGISKEMPTHVREIFEEINLSEYPVISIDIPSGIDADNGKAFSDAIVADLTIAVSNIKTGHLFGDGLRNSGALLVVDAGFPIDKIPSSNQLLLDPLMIPSDLLTLQDPFAHKSDFGHVLVIGGRKEMTGAPIMSALAALKTGAGLVTISCFSDIFSLICAKTPNEIMLKEIETIEEFNQYDTILIGPGFGVGNKQKDLIENVLKNYSKNLIIDADGINNIAQYKIDLENFNGTLCLTPHLGEFLRLENIDLTKFHETPYQIIQNSYKLENIMMLVKNSCSYIRIDEKLYFHNFPNNTLATAGSGDVLAGIIAGLWAQKNQIDLGIKVLGAVILHSLCGSICLDNLEVKSATASDLIEAISSAKVLIGELAE